MSFLKKNCTIIVLVAIIVSSLAISVLAAPTIYDETNVSEVTIQTKRLTGAYPKAEEMVLNTISETKSHCDYVWIWCDECDGVSSFDLTPYALDPPRARIVVEFPTNCWTQNHYKALYRVLVE